MAQGQCSVEGCEKHQKARGLCSMHYHRWQRHGDAVFVKCRSSERQCLYCNNCFLGTNYGHRYCSKTCYRKATHEYQKERNRIRGRLAKHGDPLLGRQRVCVCCGKSFRGLGRATGCSSECLVQIEQAATLHLGPRRNPIRVRKDSLTPEVIKTLLSIRELRKETKEWKAVTKQLTKQ